jgi:hypothetical protein
MYIAAGVVVRNTGPIKTAEELGLPVLAFLKVGNDSNWYSDPAK